MSPVRKWLDALGLGQYGDAFERNDVDEDLLAELDHDLLRQLGVASLGHRVRILRALKKRSGADSHPPAPRTDAERRQLTVMFCDLVGSTALSAAMDPEEYREVLAAYQSAAAQAIHRYDGYIARHMGDGLLVYFGYPQAHEDDPERAVRAGLDVVAAVTMLEPVPGLRLQVRIGVATGLVVAGDIVGEGASEERAVLGDTPNLAARLQAIAAPNTVVLADSTRRLARGRFELRALAPRVLKGLSTPVTAYRAIALKAHLSRFEAAHRDRLAPLVGRKAEVAMLSQRWQLAQQGSGQVVLLEGEAGIGKSRLCEAFLGRLDSPPPYLQRFQCSPYHTATAFHPVIEALQRAAGIHPENTPSAQADKLEASLAELLPDAKAMALVADLLSVPNERFAPLNMTPRRRRADTLSALAGWIQATARRGPLLIQFEDAHWSDPSTLEWLDRVVSRIRSLPAAALVTSRPGLAPPWAGQDHVCTHTLDRLEHGAIAALVGTVAQGRRMSAQALEAIVARADGVPLFAEELTRVVLDADDSASGLGVDRSQVAPDVPSTLHDALVSRLDRLGSTKEIAQIAACIGRAFGQQDLVAVSSLPPGELHDALQRLLASGLVVARGRAPRAAYSFRHALVRDAAEASLLRSRARQIHARIAAWLESADGAAPPQRLALHHARAGDATRALECYIEAGRAALARSAYPEALAHLDEARLVANALPDATPAKRLALALHSARAEALTAARGYADHETSEAYETAYRLCQELGSSGDIFPLLRGIYNNHNAQGRLRASREVAERCVAFALEQDDPAPVSLAYRLLGQNEFLTGELRCAEEHLTHAVELYDPELHSDSAQTYGLDLRSAPMKYVPLVAWLLGYPDRALAGLDENLRHGRDLGFAFNLALTTMWAHYAHMCLREHEAARSLAASLVALGHEHAMPDCVIAGEVQLALVQCVSDPDTGTSLDQAMGRLAAYRAAWGEFVVPFNLSTLARAFVLRRRPREALRTIEEALAVSEDSGECWSDAELWRIKGEVHLAMDRSAAVEARACYRQSIEIARRQHARSWQLRTATSLAQLCIEQGDTVGAARSIKPVHDAFDEGFGTADLREAKTLLDGVESS